MAVEFHADRAPQLKAIAGAVVAALIKLLNIVTKAAVINLASEEIKRMKRRTCLISLLLLLAASAVGSGQMVGPPNPSGEGKPTAPAFSVTSLKGEKLELAALRGKVVVMNFWFTGCAPCVAEFSELNGLVGKFKKKGVVFIAPTLDDVPTLKSFLKEHKFKYHIVPNAGGLIVSTYSDGSESVVFPTHIVIDKEGKIDMRVVGADRIGDLREAIARLVNVEAEKAK